MNEGIMGIQCLGSYNTEEILLLGESFGIKEVFKPEVIIEPKGKGRKRANKYTKVGKAKININDKKKINLISLILDKWMLFEVGGNEHAYVTHVASETYNVLYQIILGNSQEWSGVYKFSLKSKEVDIAGRIIDGKNTLVINSSRNYDVAYFRDEETRKEYAVTRLDYDTDEEFKKALLETGLINKEDLDIYFKPDNIIKPYLERVLPRVIIEA